MNKKNVFFCMYNKKREKFFFRSDVSHKTKTFKRKRSIHLENGNHELFHCSQSIVVYAVVVAMLCIKSVIISTTVTELVAKKNAMK